MASRSAPGGSDDGEDGFDALCVWIRAHLHEPLGWQRLSEHSGLSHLELQHLFMDRYQTTPMQWIRMQRETRARAPRSEQPFLPRSLAS